MLYKLLTYINSGVLPTKNPITDVKQALVYLGAGEVRKLLALLTATEMAVGKPKYLAKEEPKPDGALVNILKCFSSNSGSIVRRSVVFCVDSAMILPKIPLGVDFGAKTKCRNT